MIDWDEVINSWEIFRDKMVSMLMGKGEQIMPDRKKVIEMLMQIGIALDMDDHHNDAQAIRDAIGMLKEQEPIKPTWSQGKAYCGNCGHGLLRKRAHMEVNYCSYCGQAVKWM